MLAHVLATSARRRTRGFAVLRALGVTSRWTRSVLDTQGSVVTLVGLAVGVPLGIAIGRARRVSRQQLATVLRAGQWCPNSAHSRGSETWMR